MQTNAKSLSATLLIRPIKFLTVYQWKQIDLAYKKDSAFDFKAACVLITVAVVLILSRYLATSSFVNSLPAARELFHNLPYPDLWPKIYWVFSKTLNYFLLPCLVIRLVFNEKLSAHGFCICKTPKVAAIYAGMFLIVLPLVYIASSSPAFLDKYPLYRGAADSLAELVLWEAGYGFYFISMEFFFRGFLLFTLARYLGAGAIFVMVIPYTMIHFTKPMPEAMGAVVTGIALGALALRTRSIVGGVLIHVAIAWSMDFLAMYQKGDIGRLLRSLSE